jgi:PhzF family phenazine biosynthesis protein
MMAGVPVPFAHVDAFTTAAFGGNPAGVCLLDGPAPEEWMAAVAAEVNLPETAFVWPTGRRSWGLRWWTPEVEVDLCGHATLASAHVLVGTGALADGETAVFATASGELTARIDGARIELDLPAFTAADTGAQTRRAVTALLGTEPVEIVDFGSRLLVCLADRDAVLAVAPDLEALAALPHDGLIVTAADGGAPGAGGRAGYVLRFFAPRLGIAEDPVTGSAQCAAGPYWRRRLGTGDFRVEQLSARRGHLEVSVGDDGRVRMAGHAVTVIRGTLDAGPA